LENEEETLDVDENLENSETEEMAEEGENILDEEGANSDNNEAQ
jgi:hypothetical protein